MPCMSPDDACGLPKPCRYKRELDAGLRTPEWVRERCEELESRREGFVAVDGDNG